MTNRSVAGVAAVMAAMLSVAFASSEARQVDGTAGNLATAVKPAALHVVSQPQAGRSDVLIAYEFPWQGRR